MLFWNMVLMTKSWNYNFVWNLCVLDTTGNGPLCSIWASCLKLPVQLSGEELRGDGWSCYPTHHCDLEMYERIPPGWLSLVVIINFKLHFHHIFFFANFPPCWNYPSFLASRQVVWNNMRIKKKKEKWNSSLGIKCSVRQCLKKL